MSTKNMSNPTPDSTSPASTPAAMTILPGQELFTAAQIADIKKVDRASFTKSYDDFAANPEWGYISDPSTFNTTTVICWADRTMNASIRDITFQRLRNENRVSRKICVEFKHHGSTMKAIIDATECSDLDIPSTTMIFVATGGFDFITDCIRSVISPTDAALPYLSNELRDARLSTALARVASLEHQDCRAVGFQAIFGQSVSLFMRELLTERLFSKKRLMQIINLPVPDIKLLSIKLDVVNFWTDDDNSVDSDDDDDDD